MLKKTDKTEKKPLIQLSTEELKAVSGGRNGVNRPRNQSNMPKRRR
jgi:bacteriocin-like protein